MIRIHTSPVCSPESADGAPKFHLVKLASNTDYMDFSNLFSIKSYINLILKKVKAPKSLWGKFSFLKGWGVTFPVKYS